MKKPALKAFLCADPQPLRRAALLLVLLAAGLADSARGALVQYGFDFTSGSVSSHGGGVVNDAGGSFNAGSSRGDGGTYTSDIPAASLRQFTTGTGSLLVTSGALRTGTGAFSGEGVASNAAIAAAGGLTLEVWVKGGNDGIILTIAGAYNIMGLGGGYRMANGANVVTEIVSGSADRSAWTHVAAVVANPVDNGGSLTADMVLYFNGSLVGTRNTVFPFDLSRGLGVGDHPLFPGGGDAFNGTVYEPRISMGALTPPQFMYHPPEPAGAALAVMGVLMLAGRRRR